MTVVMVALPVVFQPELRRALEQIGRGRLFHKHNELDEKELEDMLNAVTNATEIMSRRKIGALMVLNGRQVWKRELKPECRLTV